MTKEELDELERLANAAIPGPWKVRERSFLEEDFVDIRDPTGLVVNRELANARPEDLEFIAAARDAVPKLIARVRELDAQSERDGISSRELNYWELHCASIALRTGILKFARKALGLSRAELATAMGLSEEAVAGAEDAESRTEPSWRQPLVDLLRKTRVHNAFDRVRRDHRELLNELAKDDGAQWITLSAALPVDGWTVEAKHDEYECLWEKAFHHGAGDCWYAPGDDGMPCEIPTPTHWRLRSLDQLIEEARKAPPMTPAEREEQRRSFAYGNLAIENPRITRAMIDDAADRIDAEACGEQPSVVLLTREQLLAEIDDLAKKLGVSGEEALRMLRAGELDDHPIKPHIATRAFLLGDYE